jgi:hypothetical protein
MTVSITFNLTTLTEITNSSGLVSFRATSTMNFIAGSSVNINVVDPSYTFQPVSILPQTLGGTSYSTVSVTTVKEFVIVLTVKTGTTPLPGIAVNLQNVGATVNLLETSNSSGQVVFRAVNKNFDSTSTLTYSFADPSQVYQNVASTSLSLTGETNQVSSQTLYMTAFYVVNIRVTDNTVSGSPTNVSNITVTLRYSSSGITLTETTNSTGQVMFQASANNDFNAL